MWVTRAGADLVGPTEHTKLLTGPARSGCCSFHSFGSVVGPV